MTDEIGSWHIDGHNMASVIRKTADGWETVTTCPNANATWREDARKCAAVPEMLEALRDALEYFNERADAEYLPGRAAPVGNREMQIAGAIRHVLAKAERDK